VRGARGLAYAEQDQWDRASEDLEKAARLPGARAWLTHAVALLRLRSGDRRGYRDACAELVKRLERADDPATAIWAARACVLAPNGMVDPTPVIRRLERMTAQKPNDCLAHHLLGPVLYRSGQLEAAARELDKAVSMHKNAEGGGTPLDWLFLAMAHQRLGNAEEAQLWLDRASQRLDRKAASGGVSFHPSWSGDRLEAAILRREAEVLLKKAAP
jgi:tetratricopeptide (TPR) repeat protein